MTTLQLLRISTTSLIQVWPPSLISTASLSQPVLSRGLGFYTIAGHDPTQALLLI